MSCSNIRAESLECSIIRICGIPLKNKLYFSDEILTSMPTKPLDRLMFVQGGLCFFCKQQLARAEASVEHLVAGANGGSNKDENCVACCKTINTLLGSMSLKEKFQVVLNQKGEFKCPNGNRPAIQHVERVAEHATAGSNMSPTNGNFALVVANLKNRENARPRTIKTRTSTIGSQGDLQLLSRRLLPVRLPNTLSTNLNLQSKLCSWDYGPVGYGVGCEQTKHLSEVQRHDGSRIRS